MWLYKFYKIRDIYYKHDTNTNLFTNSKLFWVIHVATRLTNFEIFPCLIRTMTLTPKRYITFFACRWLSGGGGRLLLVQDSSLFIHAPSLSQWARIRWNSPRRYSRADEREMGREGISIITPTVRRRKRHSHQ